MDSERDERGFSAEGAVVEILEREGTRFAKIVLEPGTVLELPVPGGEVSLGDRVVVDAALHVERVRGRDDAAVLGPPRPTADDRRRDPLQFLPPAPLSFRDYEHVLRMAAVFAAAIVFFLVWRSWMVPRDFGVYGHFRAGAIADAAARTPGFAGQAACIECHDDVQKARLAGRHAGIGCEACHGAARRARPRRDRRGPGAAEHPGRLPHVPHREGRPAEGVPADRRQGPLRGRAVHRVPQGPRPRHLVGAVPMEQDRRSFLAETTRWLMLDGRGRARLGLRRRRRARDRRRTTAHRSLVGHDHRHREVHRLRQLRPRLQGRERRAARGGLLPHVGRALPGRRPTTSSTRIVDSPERRLRRLPAEIDRTRRRQLKVFFVPEAVQPLRALALRAGLPGRRDVREPRRRRARRQDALPRLPLLRAGVPVRLPLHRPAHAHGRQVHALLPPHHEGPDDRLLRGRARPARGSSST